MISKIKRVINSKKNTCIIFDFDYTITSFDSYSSIGVFTNYLDEEYVSKKRKIDNKVMKLNDSQIDDYRYCWQKKVKLLREHVDSASIIKKVSGTENFNIRENISEIINYAIKLNVPIYIISSGCGEIIEEVLKNNNIDISKINVIANYIFKHNELVTPVNKEKFVNKGFSNYIVFGDNKSDFMVEGAYNICYTINKYYDENIQITIVDNKYKTLSKYNNKKCVFGEAFYKDRTVFYKVIPSGTKKEVIAHNLVSKYYNVPRIITSNKNTIIYEYKGDLINKTIHEYLYTYDYLTFDFNIILDQYKKSLNNIILLNENKLVNKKFYKDRISLIEKYIIENIYDEDILKKIIKEINKRKKLYAFVSQGDPTDTNISITGIFSDFENGGYNSIVGEIAILIVSLLTHGAYYYPKYNRNAYLIRPIMPKKLKISEKNIKIIIKYLLCFKNSLGTPQLKELDDYLKYYICFRLLSPMDLTIMNDKDKKDILKVLEMFYKTESFDEIIELIKGWDMCTIKN